MALLLLAAPAAAADEPSSAGRGWWPDRAFVQLGRASDTSTLSAGAVWEWRWRHPLGDGGRWGALGGNSELSLGHWRADSGRGHAVITQIGITPTLRWWPGGQPRGWFAEAGVGANVITPIYRTRQKRFSTAFNFGDHLGLGWRDASGRHEFALRFQHFSNAGIDEPNPGANFVQLRWSIAFDAAQVKR